MFQHTKSQQHGINNNNTEREGAAVGSDGHREMKDDFKPIYLIDNPFNYVVKKNI